MDYKDCAFLFMYNSKNDQALLNTLGIDHATFQELLELFDPLYYKYRPNLSIGIIDEIIVTSAGKRKKVDQAILILLVH